MGQESGMSLHAKHVAHNVFHVFTLAQKLEEEMRAQLRLGRMAQWVKELMTKTYYLSLSPVTRMLEEKNELFPLPSPHEPGTYTSKHMNKYN